MRRLGERYSAVYEDLIGTLAGAGVLSSRARYVAMWPMRGHSFGGGTLVLGRAVNGWTDTEWRTRDAVTRYGRQRIVARARALSEPCTGCPLAWVSQSWGAPRGTYSSKTSAFWRTVRGVVGGEEGTPWPSEICWSNLYKVAPAAGGNPSPSEREAMFEGAAKLLRLELAVFRPTRVLVLTGRSWFERFVEPLGVPITWGRGALVQGTGTDGQATWVVAAHPQGKNESALIAQARTAFARSALPNPPWWR